LLDPAFASDFSGPIISVLDGDTIEVLHTCHLNLGNKGAKLRARKRAYSRGEEPMTHRCVRTAVLLGSLVLAGTVVAAPVTKSKPNLRGTESDVPNQRTFEVEGKAELSRLCADKMRTQLPLSSVPTSNLALNDITVHVEAGYYTVVLPLLNPQGNMHLLYWGADTIEEVTTFIRLMQTKKIKALKAEAYSEELRRDIAKPLSEEELRVCSTDTITNFLQPCKQCIIVEWVFDGLID